jgi:isoaspartyl peptidase/L-asparaginase-like protein (Ntn-hydrolase superfamily)
MNRRKFILKSSLASAAIMTTPRMTFTSPLAKPGSEGSYPVLISTWDFGLKANEAAWKQILSGAGALDAVEHGIRVIEADPENTSVGYGGLPDRDGMVTLDACVMDEYGHAGSVTFLQHIPHPISVARMVMEKTPHVMLSGEGALQFALENGFEKQNLLTEKARLAWEKWKSESKYEPVINVENHDTVGLLAMDEKGLIAGGCSTSGLAYKMHGRVGDSPIIGAGLYVDNEVGAAVATGLGELVMRTLSAFLVVEQMRQGATPLEACKEAIQRIVRNNADFNKFQVGLLALDKNGNTAAFSIQPGFSYALRNEKINEVFIAESYI